MLFPHEVVEYSFNRLSNFYSYNICNRDKFKEWHKEKGDVIYYMKYLVCSFNAEELGLLYCRKFSTVWVDKGPGETTKMLIQDMQNSVKNFNYAPEILCNGVTKNLAPTYYDIDIESGIYNYNLRYASPKHLNGVHRSNYLNYLKNLQIKNIESPVPTDLKYVLKQIRVLTDAPKIIGEFIKQYNIEDKIFLYLYYDNIRTKFVEDSQNESLIEELEVALKNKEKILNDGISNITTGKKNKKDKDFFELEENYNLFNIKDKTINFNNLKLQTMPRGRKKTKSKDKSKEKKGPKDDESLEMDIDEGNRQKETGDNNQKVNSNKDAKKKTYPAQNTNKGRKKNKSEKDESEEKLKAKSKKIPSSRTNFQFSIYEDKDLEEKNSIKSSSSKNKETTENIKKSNVNGIKEEQQESPKFKKQKSDEQQSPPKIKKEKSDENENEIKEESQVFKENKSKDNHKEKDKKIVPRKNIPSKKTILIRSQFLNQLYKAAEIDTEENDKKNLTQSQININKNKDKVFWGKNNEGNEFESNGNGSSEEERDDMPEEQIEQNINDILLGAGIMNIIKKTKIVEFFGEDGNIDWNMKTYILMIVANSDWFSFILESEDILQMEVVNKKNHDSSKMLTNYKTKNKSGDIVTIPGFFNDEAILSYSRANPYSKYGAKVSMHLDKIFLCMGYRQMFYVDKKNPRKACPIACIPCREILANTNLKAHFDDITHPQNFIVDNWGDIDSAVIAEVILFNLKISYNSLTQLIMMLNKFPNPFVRKTFFDELKKEITTTKIGEYDTIKKFVNCFTTKIEHTTEKEEQEGNTGFQILWRLLRGIEKDGEAIYKDYLDQKKKDKEKRRKKDLQKNQRKKELKIKKEKNDEDGQFDTLEELEKSVDEERKKNSNNA